MEELNFDGYTIKEYIDKCCQIAAREPDSLNWLERANIVERWEDGYNVEYAAETTLLIHSR